MRLASLHCLISLSPPHDAVGDMLPYCVVSITTADGAGARAAWGHAGPCRVLSSAVELVEALARLPHHWHLRDTQTWLSERVCVFTCLLLLLYVSSCGGRQQCQAQCRHSPPHRHRQLVA